MQVFVFCIRETRLLGMQSFQILHSRGRLGRRLPIRDRERPKEM